MMDKPQIFAGSASQELGQLICDYLGLPLGKRETKTFADGETWVKIDENVRGRRCFVIQSTYTPVNDHLMELLMLLDALRRASAASITAVVPYFGYARQDRKDQGRVALSAKLVANLITSAGAQRVLTMDLHAAQIQGFFDIPVDNLYASPVMVEHVRQMDIDNMVVVAPDIGSVKRARNYAMCLDAPLVIIDKRRPKPNVSEVLNIIGNIDNSNAFIFDDLIDTAGTVSNAVTALLENGAKNVYAACTHGVLSDNACGRLKKSGLKKLFITNTIPRCSAKDVADLLEEVSIAPLLGETIRRINNNQSVSALFETI
ncbi:MAG: ribose-phosphate diphosphokinase [Candidatus Sumerlaeia bacterium]